MKNQEKIKKAGQCLKNVGKYSLFLLIVLFASLVQYFLSEEVEVGLLINASRAILAIQFVYFSVSMINNLFKAGELLEDINIESGLEDWKKEQEWKRNEFEKKLQEINKR